MIIIIIYLLDESVDMSQVFIENNGLMVYTSILNSRYFDERMKLKALGVIKNIVIIPNLRVMLINDDIIRSLRYFNFYN